MIQLLFKAYDDQGNFSASLAPETLQVMEDNAVYPIIGLERLEPGVQFTLVFNPSPIFSNYSGGKSNFEHIMDALLTWVNEQTARTPHDFSLVSPDGVLDAHLTVPSEWSRSLEAYQPSLVDASPNLSSLTGALSLAADTTPKPDMERAILYITPVLTSEQVAAMPDIIDRAQSLKVHVFIWLVGTNLVSATQTAETLQELADSTGGKLFLYSGIEELPSIDSYFQPLRYVYRVGYISGINQSGSHQVVMQIKQDDQPIASDPHTLSVNVQPPNPIFLSPPAVVTRSWTTEGLNGEEVLTPTILKLSSIIEFPDGFTRPLTASRLYVDGELAVENTNSPFDQFEWVLEQYTSTQSHQLRIEVEDSQGLTGASINLPVDVVIESKQAGWLTNNRLIIGAAVFGTAAVLLAVLVLAGRRLPSFQRKNKAFFDPVTQPVATQPRASAGQAASRTQPAQSQFYAAPQPPARLVSLSAEGEPLSVRPIPLNQPEITLGSDPEHSICVLDSTSISSLHARIYRTSEGEYILADFGSTSGTWLNYAPVSIRGSHLENGDLIQIGSLYFRFELSSSRILRSPTAT